MIHNVYAIIIISISIYFTIIILKRKPVLNKSIKEMIEEERLRQEKYASSIYLNLKQASIKKRKKLEKLKKNERIYMLILANIKVLYLNSEIITKGTKVTATLQRKFVCTSYYWSGICQTKRRGMRKSECMFPHIKNEKIAKEYYCIKEQNCKSNDCIFKHDIIPENEETRCSICLDDILVTKKRFSLLENCDHVHCIDCIKKWRSINKAITCTICRIQSRFALASNCQLIGQRKQDEFTRYFNIIGRIRCKYGKFCKNINACFYKHPVIMNNEYTEYNESIDSSSSSD